GGLVEAGLSPQRAMPDRPGGQDSPAPAAAAASRRFAAPRAGGAPASRYARPKSDRRPLPWSNQRTFRQQRRLLGGFGYAAPRNFSALAIPMRFSLAET